MMMHEDAGGGQVPRLTVGVVWGPGPVVGVLHQDRDHSGQVCGRGAGLIKIRSRLGTQFMAFFRLIARILTFRDKKVPYVNVSRQKVPYVNVSRQKVPYFNVSRQNRVIFDCFATKQC